MRFDCIDVNVSGESHSPKISVKLSGIPKGTEIDLTELQRFVDRRRSSDENLGSTKRREADVIEIVSGIEGGIVTGDDVIAEVRNTDAKPEAYENLNMIPRPSHADYVSYVKYGKISTGGGKFSGRMTVGLCIAGGIVLQILEKRGIKIAAYVSKIADLKIATYDDEQFTYEMIRDAQSGSGGFNLSIESAKTAVLSEIERAEDEHDSLGGIIECMVFGMPAGYGDSLFGGLESKLSYSLFAIPAVKGVEFGLGAGFAKKRGSQVNDAIYMENGKVKTRTNNSGGINGGISNGMPLTMRVTMKPTPSIGSPQESVNLATGESVTLVIKGRHDSCIVLRALPCVESMVAMAILDEILTEERHKSV